MKSVENTYQKKTHIEHILLRPDTYVGSIEPVKSSMWVYDDGKEKIVEREISFVPGLYKIFDEVLVNAADNYQRDRRMSTINIRIDQKEGLISIMNNGKGRQGVMERNSSPNPREPQHVRARVDIWQSAHFEQL